MTDIFSKEKRKKIMSSIKTKNTKPEIIVRKALFARGYRFRINDPRYPGKPDILLPKYKTAIFVHGCFWHGHDDNCKKQIHPRSNQEFWNKKIRANKLRDKKVELELSNLGWKVIVLWECEIRNKEIRNERINKLSNEILK